MIPQNHIFLLVLFFIVFFVIVLIFRESLKDFAMSAKGCPDWIATIRRRWSVIAFLSYGLLSLAIDKNLSTAILCIALAAFFLVVDRFNR